MDNQGPSQRCPPRGYKLVIEPTEAALVKRIFAMYTGGASISKTVEELQEASGDNAAQSPAEQD